MEGLWEGAVLEEGSRVHCRWGPGGTWPQQRTMNVVRSSACSVMNNDSLTPRVARGGLHQSARPSLEERYNLSRSTNT